MATTLNASTSSSGLVASGDGSGVLALQSSGVTGITVGPTNANVAISNVTYYAMTANTLGTASAGKMEYDGSVPYFTPSGTQRGVIPGMQYYALNSSLAGSNVNTAQNMFGVGVTLSSSTYYAFEAVYAISKTAGTTSHSIGLGFGGTATINNIGYLNIGLFKSTGFSGVTAPDVTSFIQTATNTSVTVTTTGASVQYIARISGTVSINAGGTFIPQYTLSAAPGGAYTTAAGSYFLIYPIGAAGANVSVGTWA